MARAEIYDKKRDIKIDYYIEDRLKRNLDTKVKGQLEKKDKDMVFVVDGKEGSGKSTLAIQIGKYVDPTLDLSRIVFSPEDFREAILKAKKGQCIIYDEAFTGFSSRSSLSPVNRVLVSLAMQMRQKNLFILIVLPTIFLLDKYMAMFRTAALIHVYESKGVRGYFKVFNDKKKKYLILQGKKTMTYNVKGVYTKFKGRFYGKFALGLPELEKKYREKKEKALADSEKTSMTTAQVKFREQRDIMIYLFRRFSKMKYQEMSNLLSDYDLEISFQQLAKICAKFGEKADLVERDDKKESEETKNEENKKDSPSKTENSTENTQK